MFIRNNKIQSVILISTILATFSGCSDVKLNPYKIDEDIPYYKDVGGDENERKEDKIITSEDGAASTVYHKTVQLPDKKINLRKDPQYVKYENIIKDSPAYNDGNSIETVYPASYTDLYNSNIMTSLNNNTVFLTNIQYKASDTIVLTVKNYTENESIDLGKIGLTIYIYDQSGDTIGVIQPQDVINDVGEITLQSPTIVYSNYIGFADGVQRYTEYEKNLEKVQDEVEEIKNTNGGVLY